MLLPAAFLFYPIGYSTVLSFFDWNGINPNPLAARMKSNPKPEVPR